MNRRSGPFDVVLFKRKRTGYLMLGAIAAVLVIIVIVIDHSRTTHTTANSGQSTEALTPLVPRQLLGGIAAVPFTTNGAAVALPSALVPLERIKPAGSSQVAPALETGDKALIVANLGEFSPLCAIDRWALLAALSHFGTFSGVREMSSSPVEPPADIATFTFRTMTFASPYVALQAVETFDRSRDVLQSPSSEDAKVFSHFDEPPYVKAAGGLPFVDLGGEYLEGVDKVEDPVADELEDKWWGTYRHPGRLLHRGDLRDRRRAPSLCLLDDRNPGAGRSARVGTTHEMN